MSPSIAHVTYLVRDYDEAIAFFTEKLNFTLLEDTLLSDKKRWVLVAPQGGNGSALLLAKADSPEQSQHIGNQTGGRVAFFLHTDDFQRDHQSTFRYNRGLCKNTASQGYSQDWGPRPFGAGCMLSAKWFWMSFRHSHC
ncbi:VOC family protein [Candidatus Villigracilis affinis]|uniref:VOC family protein n=1 Tax=Candidatus Villigracilis affinis TaxID=3140682 RepID=UPI001D9DBE30|nr:VOC family protein [Anaerolineales bacterium]